MSASRTDLMYEIAYNPSFVPARSPKVNVKTMMVDGKPQYILKNHSTGKYYELDELSKETWDSIDGKRTVPEISNDILNGWKDKNEPVDSGIVQGALQFFAEENCLRSACEPIKKKMVRLVSAFEIDVTLIKNGKHFIKKLHKAVSPALKRPLLWLTVGFIVFNCIAFSGAFAAIFSDSKSFEILGSTSVGFFFYFFFALIPVIVIHELAHAIALVHYGGAPGEIGTGLFYFGPMFFVDVTDSWMLPRRERIVVYLAGNLSTLLIASLIVTWGFLWPFPSSVSHIMYMSAFFCFYMALFNFAPPFETDGYYVLSDSLNMPRLREEAFGYLKTTVKKALRRPVEEIKGLTPRKRNILLGYAIGSGLYIVYVVYQTLRFSLYMAQDAGVSFVKITSAALAIQALSTAAIVISLSSIAYFGMTMVGYGVMFISSIKKATKRMLNYESIHDRHFSVFLYLPSQVSKSLAADLDRHIKRLAQKQTINYTVKNFGPIHSAVLRMGTTELAAVQIREHLRRLELSFYTMYRKFLLSHRNAIFEATGIHNQNKGNLTKLISDMTKEVVASGLSEAKDVVAQIIEREKRNTLYLLNSVFSTVWTLELPPLQEIEVTNTLLPTFLAEDLAITDLYDDVENFKKSTIYGFDSLAKLSAQSRENLDKALAHPERNQLLSFLEPVKTRLVLVGRTEHIEKDIPAFGSLFVCQAWSGYLDNFMSETNLALKTLGNMPPVEKQDIETLSDGELYVLNKNLSTFALSEKQVTTSLQKLEKCLSHAVQDVENLRSHFSQDHGFQHGLLDPVLSLNAENMSHLPKRFEIFGDEFRKATPQVNEIRKMVKKEYEKRELKIIQNKRKIIFVYPMVMLLSAILILVSFVLPLNFKALLAAVIAALNVTYWVVYYSKRKSSRGIRRYPSSAFSKVQLFLLFLAQTTHKFLATADVLTPIEHVPFRISDQAEKNDPK